jgi:SAM-dependent methyltransferase
MMSDVDDLRESQRQLWKGNAAAWKKWDSTFASWTRVLGDVLLDRAGVGDGQRVLDVATGTGEPGLRAAQRVGSGRVIGLDLSAEMLETAEQRAREQGVANFETRVGDACALPFAQGSFDAVICRFGVMLVPDPELAVREMVRVLTPGGRLALAVWGPPEENTWISTIMHPAAVILGLPGPAPDSPWMFRHARPGSLLALLQAAGVPDAVEEAVGFDVPASSVDQHYRMVTEMASALRNGLAAASEEQRAEVERAATAALCELVVDGTLTTRGAVWVASGEKPARSRRER